MTNEEILKKAIEKASKNGYDIIFYPSAKDTLYYIEKEINLTIKDYYFIIFSHDFAKAFWGDKDWSGCCEEYYVKKEWQYHLQQMVLEKEPLLYLKQFLNE